MSHNQISKAAYPPMTPAEYKSIRARFGMPVWAFCDMIGISWRQEIRYRNGDSAIPDSVAKLLRTIVAYDLTPEDVG
jgi:DNA-binding transcriptional regulator YiaG